MIPQEMLHSNIVLLNLQNNHIEALPESLEILINLQKLKLDYNNLKYLPDSLTTLKNLRTLTVGNNSIKTLPNSLTNLFNLQVLKVNENRIKSIPTRMGKFEKLRKLYLHKNLIQEIPVEVYKLTSMTEFSIEWFTYLSPPHPLIVKESDGKLIDKFRIFCKLYRPLHLSKSQSLSCSHRSFADFILYFHNKKPSQINESIHRLRVINLTHYICLNGDYHLLDNISKDF